MARPIRIEYEGAVYHVTSRGNEKKPIYWETSDRKVFLDTLHKVIKRYNVVCHSYCLMDNHYHLIIETPEGNLSCAMRQLNGVYTQMFNKKHKRMGHLFQGRFKAILIQKESYLQEVCRYVVLNPVRAGIADRPADWEWSSYKAMVGMVKHHACLTKDWVLNQFSDNAWKARKLYAEFVIAGIGENGIWEKVKGQTLLGDDRFVETLTAYIEGYETAEEIPALQRYVSRPKLREIFQGAAFSSRQSRNNAIFKSVYDYGYSQREVADYLGMHYTTISGIISKILKSKT